ncbi:MAG: metal ABC transporter permease [Rikenellaceae bacterium]|jgi:zinc transport system permease protein|nr:metal ABC transporter permease [Rikenellaceae bacterium]
MDFFADIVQYHFLGYALLASVLSGVACGIIGTYVVSRQLVFMSGGVTHASLGGIGIACYLGVNPIAGAMIFSLATASTIETISAHSAHGRIREDSSIGILWSVGMAIGVAFMSLTPGYAKDMMSYLFGNILTVTPNVIVALGALTVVLLLVMALAYRTVLFVAFDRDYSRSQRMPTAIVSHVMAMLTAMTIVLSIRTVGIILLIALLTFPAVIAGMTTRSYGRITLRATAAAVLANIIGLWISYSTDLPVSVTIIFVLVAMLIAAKLLTLQGLGRLVRLSGYNRHGRNRPGNMETSKADQ